MWTEEQKIPHGGGGLSFRGGDVDGDNLDGDRSEAVGVY
jgi:hypothetical protein